MRSLPFILLILCQYTHCKVYEGEYFPLDYLKMDPPRKEDFYIYLDGLKRTVDYFSKHIDTIDINRAFGMFITKVNLKSVLTENGSNIPKQQANTIMVLIQTIENQLTYYFEEIKPQGNSTKEFKVFEIAKLWIDDKPWVNSVEHWNHGRLAEHLLRPSHTGYYAEEMDSLELLLNDYLELLNSMDLFYISLIESDECMSRIANIPINAQQTMQPCSPDLMCEIGMTYSPSVAYSLSHSMVNLLARRMARGCYVQSPDVDDAHLTMLCAEMYREAVYIARNGFLTRDMFMEHIGLCSLRGHLEFIRRDWLAQILSWQNTEGCIPENHSVIKAQYYYILKNFKLNEEQAAMAAKSVYESLARDCHNHPTSLEVTTLSAAVRYTATLFL